MKFDSFSLLHFTTLLLILVHAFFLGSSKEREKSLSLRIFCCRFYMSIHKNENKPTNMDANCDMNKLGMHYVRIVNQLIPE